MRTIPPTSILLAAAAILTGCVDSEPTGVDDVACVDFLLQYGAATGDTVTAQQGLKYIEITPEAAPPRPRG